MTTFEAADFYHLDDLLTPAECRLHDDVRQWIDARFLPIVAQHYRDGTFPMNSRPSWPRSASSGPASRITAAPDLVTSPPVSSCENSSGATAACARSPPCKARSP